MQTSGIFNNFHSLKGNSTIIIDATYAAVSSTYDFSGKNIIDFSLNVGGYLKGGGNQSIYVDNTITRSIPVLPVIGQEYILFLKLMVACPPPVPLSPYSNPPTPLNQTYIPAGGPQGMFLVQNGHVYGYKTLYPDTDSWIMVDANAMPTGQFISMVNSS